MQHRSAIPTAAWNQAEALERSSPIGPDAARGRPTSPKRSKRSARRAIARSTLGLALGLSLALAATATPASANTTNAERLNAVFQVTMSGPQPHRSLIVATGVFNDVGTIQFGGDDANAIHHDTIVFSDGTVDFASPEASLIDHFSFDPTTCVGSDVETGTATMSGTGRYAGLSGQQMWTNRGIIIARRAPGCSPDQAVAYVVFTSSGTAKLGG
jgi:hypothetical protein